MGSWHRGHCRTISWGAFSNLLMPGPCLSQNVVTAWRQSHANFLERFKCAPGSWLPVNETNQEINYVLMPKSPWQFLPENHHSRNLCLRVYRARSGSRPSQTSDAFPGEDEVVNSGDGDEWRWPASCHAEWGCNLGSWQFLCCKQNTVLKIAQSNEMPWEKERRNCFLSTSPFPVHLLMSIINYKSSLIEDWVLLI